MSQTSNFNHDYHFVFVYGSLKRGFHNNYILRHSEFLGKFVTKNRDWNMVSFNAFPGVTNSKNLSGSRIAGELYLVDNIELKRLDALESNGTFYTRSEIELEGFEQPVWMYIVNNEYSDIDNIRGVSWNKDCNTLSWEGRK